MNIPHFNIETKLFPRCEAEGVAVEPESFIEPGTGSAVMIGRIFLLIAFIISLLVPFLLLAWIIGWVVDYFRRKKALAQLRGSAIEISDQQFPQIHACAQTIAMRLGMTETPLIFLVEGNTLNAAAARVAGRQVVILVDDVVDACTRSGDARTLTFILAHELAHHRLGHTKFFRSQIALLFRKLRRLDEFSCDAVANQITGDPAASAKALIVLLAGPQMLPYLNISKLIEQTCDVADDKYSKKAEKTMSHPLLLRRIHRFIA